MYSWLISTCLLGCPPEKVTEMRQEIDAFLDEPILGITLPDRMEQLESESFKNMMAMMGG